MMGALVVRPIRQKDAFAFIMEHHSHLEKPPAGDLFRVGCFVNGRMVCVGLCGRPVSRKLDDGLTVEITRVASDGTVKHAASKAVGSLIRAATALGYTRAYTYTMLDEPGTIYRATGWVGDGLSISNGKGWDSRPGRENKKLGYLQRWVRVLS